MKNASAVIDPYNPLPCLLSFKFAHFTIATDQLLRRANNEFSRYAENNRNQETAVYDVIDDALKLGAAHDRPILVETTTIYL